MVASALTIAGCASSSTQREVFADVERADPPACPPEVLAGATPRPRLPEAAFLTEPESLTEREGFRAFRDWVLDVVRIGDDNAQTLNEAREWCLSRNRLDASD